MIGLMFAPDGTLLTRNPYTQNDVLWVNSNEIDEVRAGVIDQELGATQGSSAYFIYDEPEDECDINPVPYVAVYDDDAARELRTSSWESQSDYFELVGNPNLTERGLITQLANRIYFNRYTGVVMK